MTLNSNNNGGLVLQSEGRAPPPEAGGGGGGGHVVEGNKKSLKKGPWTAVEDQILMDYVRKHGEGNWNSVQRNSGLNRCGKSCRLRWANHLRPNLKKGAFSPEEKRLILELHAKYGNKWARMASQLPGRTDNEIKNYWNTRVKRRQRQGLPLYPRDIKQSQQSHSHSHSHSHSQSHHHSHSLSHSQPTTLAFPQSNTTQNHLLATNGTTPTFCFQIQSPTQENHHHTLSPPSLSPLSSPHHPKPTTTFTSLPIFDSTTTSSFTFHGPAPILGAPLRYKRYRESVGSSPPISPTPQRSTSILHTGSLPDISSFQLTGTNSMPELASFQFPRAFNPTLPPLPRTQFEFSDTAAYSIKSELPSNQLSQTHSEVTVDTKVTSTTVAASTVVAATAEETHNNSGLLDELLQEAEALASGGGNNSRRSNALLGSFDDKHVLDGYGRWLQSTSSMDSSLLEAKPTLQDDHHLNSMPEDLSKLFSFIPLTDSVSDWYSTDSGELSNGQSSGVTDASLDFEMQHMASLFPVGATAEHGRASNNWDNMPGIC